MITRSFLGALLFPLVLSCTEKHEPTAAYDVADRVISLAVETRTGEAIELPEMYTRAVRGIPADDDQNLILAGKLELRGFKKTGAKHLDQQLSGRRIFAVTMEKDDCRCEASKIYYATANVSEYFVSERIACQTIKF